jgi:CTP:phosphocholine cytidylyltransferase-like protein
MNIIILGDKFQKRMKSKGCMGLFKTKNMYRIVQQYQTIKKIFPIANMFYVYGFESKKLLNSLEKYQNLIRDVNFIYNDSYDKYNYGYSLSLVSNYLSDDTIICFGDTSLSNLHLLGIKDQFSKIIISNNTGELGCVISNSKIENVFYDLENPIEEIYFIKKQDISILKEILQNKSLGINNMFIFEIINKMIDKNVMFKPIQNNKTTLNKKIKSKYVI